MLQIDKFRLIFNNIVIRKIIFKNVKIIHKQIKVPSRCNYEELLNNKYQLLVQYNYFELFKQFMVRNEKKFNESLFLLQDTVVEIVQYNRVSFLEYLVNSSEGKIRIDYLWHPVNILIDATKYNSFEILLYIFENVKLQLDPEDYKHTLQYAVENNNFEMLKWLSDRSGNGRPFNNRIKRPLAVAASRGNLPMVQWLVENRQQDNISDISTAIQQSIKEGHLDIIEWLYNNNYITNDNIYNQNSISNNNNSSNNTIEFLLEDCSKNSLDCIKWIKKHNYLKVDENSLTCAAPYFPIVKWLHEEYGVDGIVGSPMVMNEAVKYWTLDEIIWLHNNRPEGCSKQAMDNAAFTGRLDIVKWLHENRTEGCTQNAMFGTAVGGHLEVYKFFQHNRTEGYTVDTVNEVCRAGKLEMLKYLHQPENCTGNNQHLCTSFAFDQAAMNGHLLVLKWLVENRTEGCTEQGLLGAIQHNHFEVAQYILENKLVELTTNGMYTIYAMYQMVEKEILDYILEYAKSSKIVDSSFTFDYLEYL